MSGKARRRRCNAALLCADDGALQATIDRYGGESMAIAGGMTGAYKCQIQEYRLTADKTTYPSKDCANIEAAVTILGRGESCIVAAGDVAKLRQRLASFGIG